jgi:hypothetical protein
MEMSIEIPCEAQQELGQGKELSDEASNCGIEKLIADFNVCVMRPPIYDHINTHYLIVEEFAFSRSYKSSHR